MKGPGFRLDLDVRRVWECPACGKRLKAAGATTQLNCDCRADASPPMRLVERLKRTESPFDHVGFAAQKRIDAAIKKPHGPPLPESDEDHLSVPGSVEGSDADLRPPDETLPETTHAIDGDASERPAEAARTEGDPIDSSSLPIPPHPGAPPVMPPPSPDPSPP